MLDWKNPKEETPKNNDKILFYIDDLYEVFTGYYNVSKKYFYDEQGDRVYPDMWASINIPF